MILAHHIQLDPTCKQRAYFAKAAGTARMVWNWALAEWNEQYAIGGRPNGSELRRYFNSFKYQKFPWLKNIHRDAHDRPFDNLNRAFESFFKNPKHFKHPKFKKKGKCHDGFYVACDRLTTTDHRVRLPVIGWVKMREKLRFEGKVKSAIVKREADKWFLTIVIEVVNQKPTNPSGPPIGVDFGLKTFATLSTGEKIQSPKPLSANLRRLRRLSRWHSRKQWGSNNRQKAILRLARLHRRIRNVRRDFIHKFTTHLAKNHSEICVEDLAVKDMAKYGRLARSIYDAAWGETRRQLDYKTRLYGSKLTVRDKFFASSKTCSMCGYQLQELDLSTREWVCPSCGTLHDRDENAAKNLLIGPLPAAKPGSNACGDCGSDVGLPQRETAVMEAGTTTGSNKSLSTP